MKYEYIEGRKARENFEKAMTAAFQVPKEQVPRPQPKKRKARPASTARTKRAPLAPPLPPDGESDPFPCQ